ncbi:MAG: DNA replication/repair protein RecF [Lachnospiraceae bacterium]|nr:DNA replication/repair protein RecF [Lachnospiraceae bacterium]
MLVKSVELYQYRSYPSLRMEPAPGINLIYGDNAQGKTNLLEAVYLCATGTSHRGAKDREIIAFEEKEAAIRLVVEKGGIDTRIDFHLNREKNREVSVNQVPLKRMAQLPGYLHVVFFSPEDLKIIKSSPVERRSFLNVELCQLSSAYTWNLVEYKKTMTQRNALLKMLRESREYLLLLDAYDEKLAAAGEKIMAERESFTEEMEEIVRRIHQELSGGKEELRLRYVPGTERGKMEEKLFGARERDIAQGSTSQGPQRDELEFSINGNSVKNYGSQGQQRTTALSLKLGEIEVVKRKLGEPPVLLLDDVLSELDEGRQEKLLGSLNGIQTFLTCTGLDDFVKRQVQAEKKWKVTKGTLTEEDT